jgi:hypothetical protein
MTARPPAPLALAERSAEAGAAIRDLDGAR